MSSFTSKSRIRFIPFLVLLLLFFLPCCSVLHIKKIDRSVQTTEIQEKKINRAVRKQERLQARIYNKMVRKSTRRHMKIQSRETSKRMKQNEKRAQKLNKERRRPFFERLFDRRCN